MLSIHTKYKVFAIVFQVETCLEIIKFFLLYISSDWCLHFPEVYIKGDRRKIMISKQGKEMKTF